jgi:hypothetical protein
MSTLIHKFTSHTSGKNAQVSIFQDRIEWEVARGVSGGKLALGAMTLGLSVLATGFKNGKTGSEMIPVSKISSVQTRRDGFSNTVVSVVTAGNTIDFRVSHAEAKIVRDTIVGLM